MLVLKEPHEALTLDELRELYDDDREFDRWLKHDKKMCNYPNARKNRQVRRETMLELIKKRLSRSRSSGLPKGSSWPF